MNGVIANIFNSPYPTAIQTSLESFATIARYDPSGRFIAAGRNDGLAVIWDLDTKGPVRWLEAHVKGITSVDWSQNSRYVLTSSKDWNIVVWDLASDTDPPKRRNTIRYDMPVTSASFHPKNSKIILILLTSGEVHIEDLRRDQKSRYELLEVQDDSDEEASAQRARSVFTVARFDPSGKHVFLGTSLGHILVFNTRTKTMVARHKISGAGAIRGLEFTASGRRIVTNSSDRVLRQFILPVYAPPTADEYIEQELEPTHRFHDPISKVAWHAMSYSPDGEWLAGGAADDASHKIYIWDLAREGLLASTLDGGRELLTYVHWHPSKPSIASVTNQGNIFIWHCPTEERWGAFAGGFEEVDENIEYEEREDEFDIEDEAEIARRKMLEEEEDVDINGEVEDTTNGVTDPHPHQNGENDEDTLWALEDPDDDLKGWKLKVLTEEEELM